MKEAERGGTRVPDLGFDGFVVAFDAPGAKLQCGGGLEVELIPRMKR